MIRPNLTCYTWKDAWLTISDGDRTISYFKGFFPGGAAIHAGGDTVVIKIDYHGDDPMNSTIATL